MALILLLLFLTIMFIGVPIGFAMGFTTIISFLMLGGNMAVIPQKLFSSLDNFTYLCIPLFILASEMMSSGGITENIVRFCDTLVGHIRGGLAHVNVLGSMFFAGISGSATADVAGLGALEVDMMTRAGYSRDYSAAVTAASAIIGPIIPPSGIMIIYAVVAGNISAGKMFLGGIIPGILLGLGYMFVCYIKAVKNNHPRRERMSSFAEIGRAAINTLPSLMLPVIIIGGISSGVFTATESAAIAVLYAFIITKFVTKSLDMKTFFKCCISTAKTTANVMFIIAIASAMGWVITALQIPQQVTSFFINYVNSRTVFLIFTNLILLLIGAILDQSPALLIMAPILLPVAKQFGVDPLHYGLIMVFNLCIGLITPPVGMTLFVTSNVAKVKLDVLYREILPFVAIAIVVLLLITFVPQTVLFIPNLL